MHGQNHIKHRNKLCTIVAACVLRAGRRVTLPGTQYTHYSLKHMLLRIVQVDRNM